MDLHSLCEALRTSEICQGLTHDEMRSVAEAGTVSSVAAGVFLMREGEDGDSMCVLLEGEAAVLKEDEAGGRHRLATLGRGAVFGEAGLLTGFPRTATVESLTPARVFRIDRASFERLVEREDIGALKVGLAVARTLAIRQHALGERLVELLDAAGSRNPSAEVAAARRHVNVDTDM